MVDQHTKVIAYVGDNTNILRKQKQIVDANRRMAKIMGKNFSRVTDVIGQDFDKMSRTYKKAFDPATGKEYLKTVDSTSQRVKLLNGKMGTLTKTVHDQGKTTQKTAYSFRELGKNTVSLKDNIKRLASRAAITIPVWMALRGAVMGATRAMSNGLKNIIEYDKQLQRLRKNLQGTSQEVEQNFKKAEKIITDFSIKTGKSTEDITRAIQRFATVGFEYETAMEAGLDATRLSILLFGEAEGTANAFARSMRVLVSDIDNGEKSAKEIAEAFALTSELYEVNAFELKELNSGMEKFAGTAKSMNFTTAETITLLAALSTRGLNAERAGRLLRTTMTKMESKFGDISKVLGIKVNPEMDRTYDVFMKVINAIALLKKKSGAISPELTEAISAMFGGVRQGEVVRDLIADIDKVNEAFKKFTKARPDINKFRQDVEGMNDALFRQSEIWTNLKKETGKAFVKAITGGEEFTRTIKDGTSQLLVLKDILEIVGDDINSLFAFNFGMPIGVILKGFKEIADESSNIHQEIVKGLRGELGRKEIIDVLARIKIGMEDKTFEVSQHTINALHKQIKKQMDLKLEESPIEADLRIKGKKLEYERKKSLKFELKRQKTSEVLLKDELERMKILGASNSELIEAEIYYTKGLNLHREDNDILRKKLEYERSIKQEIENQKQVLIGSRLEMLKLQGATSLQLIERKKLLEESYGINRNKMEQLNLELNIQKEITKEKLEQDKVSSETLKLYKISQKYGITAAKGALAVLRGERGYEKLEKEPYGKVKEALEEFFPALLEARKAALYFAEGFGRYMPIKEKGYQQRVREQIYRTETGAYTQRDIPISPMAKMPSIDLKLPKIETRIENVKIELKKVLKKEDLTGQILDDLAIALKDNPSIKESVENIIENY